MDFGRAFTFVGQDADWVKKILIGGLISLIPIVGALIVYGYVLEVIRGTYVGGNGNMPEWDDFGGYLVRGLVVAIGLLIWMLPIIVLGICVGAITAATGDSSDILASFIALAGLCLIGILILAYVVALLPIIAARYAVQRTFSSMFQFSEVIDEVRRAGTALLLVLLIAIVAQLVASLGYLACIVGVVFTSFYAQLVLGHAAGQLYRQVIDARTMDVQPEF